MTTPFESAPHPRIALVLGKPIRQNTILAGVLDLLATSAATVEIYLPTPAPPPPWLTAADLIVQRGLDLPHLAALLPLEVAGIRCCNRIAATIVAGDRTQVIRDLAAAGLPVPATAILTTWPEVLAQADGRPVVVKAADGTIGRGEGVIIDLSDGLPEIAPFPGPFTLQEYIPNDGRTYKVYVAGRETAGVSKPWPATYPANRGIPFDVVPTVADLVHRAGDALGLEIYGIDLVFGPDGPVIVDANPFPGFRGVHQSAPRVAAYLLALSRRGRAEP